MRAEIIGIGTELLLGQIVNTNAQRISTALATVGIDVMWHVVVGDNHERMCAAIRTSIERSDAVIITGGLGPTPDDITREAIAEVAGRPLERVPELVEQIETVFKRFGRDMPEANLKQADLPQGANPIAPEGTAPGFYLDHGDALVVALPGVPWEMEAMLGKTVLPLLRARAGDSVILSRHVLVMGLGESATHEKVADIVDAQTNPTIAFLASHGQVRLRITAKAATESEALGLIAPVESALRERLGRAAVPGDHSTIASALGEMLRERGITVAVAESLTGGLIGATLSDIGGSGDYYLGSLVCYSTESKEHVAEVDPAILQGPGPVSEEAAGALAEAAARKFKADLGVSATGVAGPAEQDGMPVGTVFVGACVGGRTEVRRVKGYGDRSNIRGIATSAALDLGRRMIEEA
ncbi:MAG TPA: competence/damage-inducible protein A [Actinomycetota bacterium]|nr:competence/damage-inducible protein A [Actinomycetota bacterium]